MQNEKEIVKQLNKTLLFISYKKTLQYYSNQLSALTKVKRKVKKLRNFSTLIGERKIKVSLGCYDKRERKKG
jgi:hypothetical protein